MLAKRTAMLLALAGVCLARPTVLEAQQSGSAFDTLTIAVHAVANVNRNEFHDYWEPRPGLEIQFTTPFYLGTGEAGVHYAGFEAKHPEQPDFTTLFVYLGWGYEWSIVERLGWYNGLRTGSFIMVFDSPEERLSEQEFAFAFNSQARYRLTGRWALEIAARYRIVFTHERLRYVFLAAGISHSFGTPQWLRDFLD